jgi:hypothetical protein
MKHALRAAVFGCIVTVGVPNLLSAQVFTEDFNDPFPAWESGWFGQNTDARNLSCPLVRGCADRGSNPFGLWLDGVSGGILSNIVVNFLNGVSTGITSLSMEVNGFVPAHLSVFDIHNVLIYQQEINSTESLLDGVVYTINSTSGMSRFEFEFFAGASGNIAIDDVVVTSDATVTPEPVSIALLGTGLAGLAALRRRRRRRTQQA